MSRTGAEHRTAESQALFGLVDGVTRVVLQATRDAWREQGQLWSRTVEQMGESQIVALQTSSQRIVQQIAEVAATQHDQFQRFLAGVETLRQLNQKATAEFTARMTAHQATAKQQVELLAQLVGAEGRAEELQQTLNENLAALANAQQLDQAIHSLTAAVHLLTVRTGSASQSAHVALGNNCTAREAA
jgi:ABC-type enterochelin transport system substrate-binding protein